MACETCGQLECVCADRCAAEPERPRLLPGDEMQRRKCGAWHTVVASEHASRSAQHMLWFACPQASGLFYAGTFGLSLMPDEVARWRPGPQL